MRFEIDWENLGLFFDETTNLSETSVQYQTVGRR